MSGPVGVQGVGGAKNAGVTISSESQSKPREVPGSSRTARIFWNQNQQLRK